MSGVERERNRVKATGEVFTPTPLVEEILDKMDQQLFIDPTKTFLDPSCGDGQFLASVLYT
jgi:type I restriction-modification system DNA methylase subunit